MVIPFDNQIRKDTDLYKLFNTNIHEKIAEQETQTRSQKIARLKVLTKAYSECEAYKAVAEESGSLSGLK